MQNDGPRGHNEQIWLESSKCLASLSVFSFVCVFYAKRKKIRGNQDEMETTF